jgi:hypothetical protein
MGLLWKLMSRHFHDEVTRAFQLDTKDVSLHCTATFKNEMEKKIVNAHIAIINNYFIFLIARPFIFAQMDRRKKLKRISLTSIKASVQ